jgi:hypothetical protein
MSLAHRVEMWTALARDAAALARDYAASFVVDADHASPGLPVSLGAARGQVRGLVAERLPYSAWEEGREFLFLLGRLVDEDATPAARLQNVDELIAVSARLIETLSHSTARPRADLDD